MFLLPFGFYNLSQLDFIFHDKVLLSFNTIRVILFLIFFITGIFFAVWSNMFLNKIGKGGPTEGFGVAISPKTKKLVTIGPYKYSRNPMAFGAFSLYLSIVLFLNSITGFIVLICFFSLAMLYLKKSEEKRLIKDFGNKYIDYMKRVPMIIPIKLTKQFWSKNQ